VIGKCSSGERGDRRSIRAAAYRALTGTPIAAPKHRQPAHKSLICNGAPERMKKITPILLKLIDNTLASPLPEQNGLPPEK
jgi:hypothetical protein